MKAIKTLVAVAVTLLATAAQADITIGISLPLTGPASGLGIPMNNYIKLWPTEIAGEKLKTAPKGYERTHPDIDLLQFKQVIVIRQFTDAEIVKIPSLPGQTSSHSAA